MLLDRMASPIGEMLLVTDTAGVLRALDFADCADRMWRLTKAEVTPGAAPAAIRQALANYFAGDLAALAPIFWDGSGTAFQRLVWAGLVAIPVGTTMTYSALAAQIVADGGEFDTVYVRHVVEHISDLDDFFAGIRILLRPNGVLVLELPEVEEAFALGSPAILWEEHVSYFTEAHVECLLKRFGFHISDRRRYVFGGGSIAFVARKVEMSPQSIVSGTDPRSNIDLLHRFAGTMQRQRDEMNSLVAFARSSGHRPVIYGAAPRSCMLVSVSGIAEMIDFVIDDREDIHGRLFPGTRHVIQPLSKVAEAMDSNLLCLLGVGCENEFKVRARIEAATNAEIVFVSLLPPRDMLESVAAARRLIITNQEAKGS